MRRRKRLTVQNNRALATASPVPSECTYPRNSKAFTEHQGAIGPNVRYRRVGRGGGLDGASPTCPSRQGRTYLKNETVTVICGRRLMEGQMSRRCRPNPHSVGGQTINASRNSLDAVLLYSSQAPAVTVEVSCPPMGRFGGQRPIGVRRSVTRSDLVGLPISRSPRFSCSVSSRSGHPTAQPHVARGVRR